MPQVALWGKGILYHKRFYNLFLTSLASIDSFFSWQNLLALESCGFEANYKKVQDQIITSYTYYDDAKTIALLKKDNSINSLSNLQIMVSLMPGFLWKCYYPILACGIVSQYYKVDYRGNVKSMDNPLAVVKFNNIFKFRNNYMATVNYSWHSEGNSENIKMGSVGQINLSLAKDLSKNWNIKLSAYDIFDTASKNTFTIFSDMNDVYVEKSATTRAIECTVRYKFNAVKTNYKGKGAEKKEMDRL